MSVATPLLSSMALPRTVVPSVNVTVPLAVPPVAATTRALNVIGCPTTIGLGEEVSVVVVTAFLMVWTIIGDVLDVCRLLPLYTAFKLCVPPLSFAIDRLA